jgi:hypothetical protein
VGVAFTIFWIVGMINSINWIDGLDGLSSGIGLIAAFTLGLISLTFGAGRWPALRCPAVLRPGRRPAGLPALELPPGLDLRRDERGDAAGLLAGDPVDPRLGQGGRGPAGPGRADHRHVLEHRPATGHRQLAVHPGPRPRPSPADGPGPEPDQGGPGDLRDHPGPGRPVVRAVGHAASCTASWAWWLPRASCS